MRRARKSARRASPLSLRDPLAPWALRAVLAASGLLLLTASVGAAVRLLPWVLDPTIAWAALAPFARSLAAIAVEASVLTGWGVGWARAAQRFVERGEARVLASVGERPSQTLRRLLPQGLVLALFVGTASAVLGAEAVAPGRVVQDLLAEGRRDCLEAEEPEARRVPLVAVTWLCNGRSGARLAGRSPIGGVAFVADDARVSEDLRRIELDEAHLLVGSPRVEIRVRSLVLRGLSPLARASSLPPWLRALLVGAAGAIGASAAFVVLLRSRRRRIGPIAATALGAAGPLGALAVLRALETRVPEVSPGAWLLLFGLVPVAAALGALAMLALLSLLPEGRAAGSRSG